MRFECEVRSNLTDELSTAEQYDSSKQLRNQRRDATPSARLWSHPTAPCDLSIPMISKPSLKPSLKSSREVHHKSSLELTQRPLIPTNHLFNPSADSYLKAMVEMTQMVSTENEQAAALNRMQSTRHSCIKLRMEREIEDDTNTSGNIMETEPPAKKRLTAGKKKVGFEVKEKTVSFAAQPVTRGPKLEPLPGGGHQMTLTVQQNCLHASYRRAFGGTGNPLTRMTISDGTEVNNRVTLARMTALPKVVPSLDAKSLHQKKMREQKRQRDEVRRSNRRSYTARQSEPSSRQGNEEQRRHSVHGSEFGKRESRFDEEHSDNEESSRNRSQPWGLTTEETSSREPKKSYWDRFRRRTSNRTESGGPLNFQHSFKNRSSFSSLSKKMSKQHHSTYRPLGMSCIS